MAAERPTISELSGPLAVGSISFAGAFLIVDGVNGLFLLIEQYAQSATWAILFAVPTLVLSYAFGVICIRIMSMFRSRYDKRCGRDAEAAFVSIASLKNDQLVARFLDLQREQEFLLGASPSLVVLGVGLFFAVRWMGGFYLFGYLAGAGCIGLGAVLPLIAHYIALQSFHLAEIATRRSDA